MTVDGGGECLAQVWSKASPARLASATEASALPHHCEAWSPPALYRLLYVLQEAACLFPLVSP